MKHKINEDKVEWARARTTTLNEELGQVRARTTTQARARTTTKARARTTTLNEELGQVRARTVT